MSSSRKPPDEPPDAHTVEQGDNPGDDDVFNPSAARKDIKDKRGPKKSLDAKLGRKGEAGAGRAKLGRKRRQDSDTDDADD